MKKLKVTRREFCTMVLSAGFSGDVAHSEETKEVPNRTLQIAIVGIDSETSMFSLWLRNLKQYMKNLNVSILAVCEKDIEILNWKRRIAQFGYTDFREMLREQSGKIDAVVISPLFSKAENCISACLELGIPVYCSLPLSPDVGSGKRIIQCAHKSGTLLYCSPLTYGDDRKFIQFSREKLCGEEKLLGNCIRIAAKSYIRTEHELYTSPRVSQTETGAEELFRNSLGYRVMLRQCVNFLLLYPAFPRSVMGFQTSFGKLVSSADLAVFQYENGGHSVSAELSLQNVEAAINDRFHVSFFGEFGAAHISCIPKNSLIEMEFFCGSRHGDTAKFDEYRKRWCRAVRHPSGLLGDSIDIAGRHYDDRTVNWRCETDEEYRALYGKSASFKGKRDLWLFPKSLLDETSEPRTWSLEDFFSRVSSGNRNCDTAINAYRAEVMVDGVEQSLKTGKPFIFTPEMFEV